MPYNQYPDPYQQQNPYETLPPPPPFVPPTQLVEPEKKKGSNKGWIWTGIIVPILVAIIGLSAHAATSGSSGSSGPSGPSIPQLHSNYRGTVTDLVFQRQVQLSLLDVSEDSNGNFQAAATVDQSCTATISKASVNTSGAVSFQLDQIANTSCDQASFMFLGQINSAGSITGTWTEPNSTNGDNGTFTLS
jgi:hypothetical protein